MHELKIIQDIFPIIENVAQEHHLKKVSRVVLQVGALRQVVLEFLQFAFATVARDTIAKQAKLIIEVVPITVRCNTCQQQTTVQENVYICPKCGGGNLEVLTGKEIVLVNISGETS